MAISPTRHRYANTSSSALLPAGGGGGGGGLRHPSYPQQHAELSTSSAASSRTSGYVPGCLYTGISRHGFAGHHAMEHQSPPRSTGGASARVGAGGAHHHPWRQTLATAMPSVTSSTAAGAFSSGDGGSGGSAGVFESITACERRHADEKRQLDEEIERIMTYMSGRHDVERQAAIARQHEEDERQREVELAAQRLQAAQAALDALRHRPSLVMSASSATTGGASSSGIASELDSLRKYHAKVAAERSYSAGLNTSDGVTK